MFDLAVGGSWGGLPDTTTIFPQKFLVDWVRVYQRKPAEKIVPVVPMVFNNIDLRVSVKGIGYTLKKEGRVRIGLFDALGKQVVSLLYGHQAAGRHDVEDILRIKPGVYVVEFEYNGSCETSRVVLK